MNRVWLNKQGNTSCILFFNGWGMDENAVKHLDAGSFDVCMFNDYNPLLPIDEALTQYSAIYAIAWSLGVWVAAKLLSNSELKIAKAIAINGTLKPIDLREGIAPIVFNGTLNSWCEENRIKFNTRMVGGRKEYALLKDRFQGRDIDNQKNELNNIQNEVTSNTAFEMLFDCALVGSNDLIFTPTNQYNYWNSRTRIVNVDSPHYPFTKFCKWEEIIAL